MGIKFQPEFTRQVIPTLLKGILVIPQRTSISKTFANAKIHTEDYPFSEDFFDDGKTLTHGVHKFKVKDAVLGIYDLSFWTFDHHMWSFATTDQTLILAALKIGETFDVKIDKPFNRILYIGKSHIPSGVASSGYGSYAVEVKVNDLNLEGLRITTSYEPDSKTTESRLPFFFGFKIYGFRSQDTRPEWKKFLSEAVIFAQKDNWAMGLLYIAISLESFMTKVLKQAYEELGLPDGYISRRTGRNFDRTGALHVICNNILTKDEINKLDAKLNEHIFTLRNNIVHGKKNIDDIVSEQYVQGLKSAVEFIWDSDKASRKHLVLIDIMHSPSLLIDQSLIETCLNQAE